MSTGSRNQVFTASEIARAAGVPTEAVLSLIQRGELRFIDGTRYISVPNAPRTARRLRETALALLAQPTAALFRRTDSAPPRTRKPAVASLAAHVAVALLAVLLSMGHTQTASIAETPHEESHLVFLLSPGPGGGGGGGGLRQPKPAPKIARRGESHLKVSVPPVSEKPVIQAREEAPKPTPVEPVIQPAPQPAPEPVPAKVIVAPVATVAANDRDRDGAIEHPVDGPDSHGPGDNGGVGSGQGTGNGEGLGSGIGQGEGGGTGGGPYRPGSGIEPPRLLREVKAQYTEEARRRGITGDVLLEIVIRRDGTVGDVRVLQGLGAGLEERAITAVRQWRFDAARRKGVPVDVLVEVAVEFTLR
jgi:periplasmic protein TonB